jgi:hypothetical protein
LKYYTRFLSSKSTVSPRSPGVNSFLLGQKQASFGLEKKQTRNLVKKKEETIHLKLIWILRRWTQVFFILKVLFSNSAYFSK